MRKLLLVGLLAFAVALAGTAYAEVQNIKVGGDIDLKAISTHNYDLKEKNLNVPGGGAAFQGGAVTNDDNSSFFLSTVRVTVDADLTDNVSAHVRLLNQRIWDAAISATDQINIDNAYVVLKEFLYSPLTVMVGRQDLNYGTGFIVGPGLLADPNGAFSTVATGSQGQIGQEHSAYNSYDAIRMILDFAPVTIEGLIAKINETGVSTDDQDLYGVIVNYKVGDEWNSELEPYWFHKNDESAALSFFDSIGTTTYDVNRVHTIGLRIASSPVQNLKLNLEGAGQFGELEERTLQLERDREAYAALIEAHYTWADCSWTPTTGFGWVFFSGDEGVNPNTPQANQQQVDDVESWDQMYRGSFFTYINEFFAGFGGTNLYTTFDTTDTASNTNRHLFYGDLSFMPMEDITVWARYSHIRFDEEPIQGRSSHAGDELDMKVVYAYTEDVDLGLGAGWFIPGQYYEDAPNSNVRGDDLAYTVVGSASVKF
ncbi:MAG: alginate export family protein [Candidatus Omnitrophica bacterium]|nr:alginate export family protein [Candidatus Omnitrophota bacterium]